MLDIKYYIEGMTDARNLQLCLLKGKGVTQSDSMWLNEFVKMHEKRSKVRGIWLSQKPESFKLIAHKKLLVFSQCVKKTS